MKNSLGDAICHNLTETNFNHILSIKAVKKSIFIFPLTNPDMHVSAYRVSKCLYASYMLSNLTWNHMQTSGLNNRKNI